ncbi:Serine/threonine-protein kinase PAK 1 [Oopsacas minuta]|uniref:Serine/threonine-protein kinase PAK 1 n=1 Tax=Oopsacas minuta TaxID=111878 RepID=A0AAV7JN51_9METZ|nr:Serine/threonine-protein kinase PAK 1 [Oopsacas minuta]
MLKLIKSQFKKCCTRCTYNAKKSAKTEIETVKTGFEKYELIEQIGEGGCAKIFLANNIVTNEKCAIKCIETKTEKAKRYLQYEISTMQKMKGIKGVVQMQETFKDDEETTHIVMEHINGWCLQDVVENLQIDERVIATLCKSILKSLQQVHARRIIHRDIKCGNIMLTKDGETKLIDFGYATYCPEGGYVKSGKVGSMFWMAPEIFQKEAYNHKADIWSFGIMVLEMYLGDPPYYGSPKTNETIVTHLAMGDVPIPGGMSSKMQNFVRRCLAYSPDERPNVDELLDDVYLRDTVTIEDIADNINRMFKVTV